jgi:large subunit ribosomal protein L24
MAKMMIRKGDRVRVVRGNDRGKEGTVLRVDREKSRVVVEGVNVRKRHRKPSATDPEGGIISFEAPIHVSNVMLLDPATSEPTRVRLKANADGSKDRIAVGSGRAIPRA